MSAGAKYNNLAIIDGQSFEDKYGITHAVAANLHALQLSDDRTDLLLVWYNGSAAIATTLTAMINCPKGTIVYDMQAHTTVEKSGAVGTSTWVTSAARA